jgi:hypothetical protein
VLGSGDCQKAKALLGYYDDPEDLKCSRAVYISRKDFMKRKIFKWSDPDYVRQRNEVEEARE